MDLFFKTVNNYQKMLCVHDFMRFCYQVFIYLIKLANYKLTNSLT